MIREARSSSAGRLGRVAVVVVAALVAHGTGAAAQTVLPPDAARAVGGVVPFAGFVDEQGRDLGALAAAADARPWIVSPMYTRCPHTCVPLTTGLRAALARSGLGPSEYRVVSLSFDPHETAESLRAFRAKMQLPPDWLTVHATDREALARTLASLDVRTIELGDGQYAHPNLVAVLAPDRRLTEYLFGVRFDPGALAAAVRRAPSGPPRSAAWDAYVFVLAAVGLVLSAFVFVSVLLRSRARPRRAEASHPS